MATLEFSGEVVPSVNVLDKRYASPEMRALFSDDGRVFTERGIWVGVMETQRDLSMVDGITDEVIADYEAVQGNIDQDSMAAREKISRHDVNARIAEYNELAGHQLIQVGMTSRDLTETFEQAQILSGLSLMRERTVSTLARFGCRAVEFRDQIMVGRTHNVPAQLITLGKRIANFGEDQLLAFTRLDQLIDGYPVRGIKGPVGTQQDMMDLAGQDADKVSEFDNRIASLLGFRHELGSVNQVYPRSLDFEVVAALAQTATAPVNFTQTLRLMAGHDLASEGFKPGRVGSNGMPHKQNASGSERVRGLFRPLATNVAAAAILAGDQWNEGDVACSATRRVIIPNSFFAADGIQLTTMTVLDDMEVFPAMMEAELTRELPFLASSAALLACIRGGVPRGDAHNLIKQHAVDAKRGMLETGSNVNDFFDRLANDERVPLARTDLDRMIEDPKRMIGRAAEHVDEFAARVDDITRKYPDAASYTPPPIL